MIKAFLFDYDGVITEGVKDNVPATRLAHNLGVPVEQASEWIISIWDGFSTGVLDEAEALRKIEEQYGQAITTEQRDIWYTWEELRPLSEMLELVRELKAAGYRAGLLSNVLPVTARIIREHGGYDDFDFLALSYEVGARKPATSMYQAAFAQLDGIKPGEILYLDDRESLTEAASKLGIKTMHVTDQAAAAQEIRQLIRKQLGQ